MGEVHILRICMMEILKKELKLYVKTIFSLHKIIPLMNRTNGNVAFCLVNVMESDSYKVCPAARRCDLVN